MLRLIILVVLYSTAFTSCNKPQVLEISVRGQVRDENNKGVANVTILIDRGSSRGNWWPPAYDRFDSVVTNGNGNYVYLITEWKGYHRVCCRIPTQYSAVEPYCTVVDKTITDGKTVPNIINFRLRQ